MEAAVEAVTDDRAYNHSAELVPELGMAAHRVNKNSQEEQVSGFPNTIGLMYFAHRDCSGIRLAKNF